MATKILVLLLLVFLCQSAQVSFQPVLASFPVYKNFLQIDQENLHEPDSSKNVIISCKDGICKPVTESTEYEIIVNTELCDDGSCIKYINVEFEAKGDQTSFNSNQDENSESELAKSIDSNTTQIESNYISANNTQEDHQGYTQDLDDIETDQENHGEGRENQESNGEDGESLLLSNTTQEYNKGYTQYHQGLENKQVDNPEDQGYQEDYNQYQEDDLSLDEVSRSMFGTSISISLKETITEDFFEPESTIIDFEFRTCIEKDCPNPQNPTERLGNSFEDFSIA